VEKIGHFSKKSAAQLPPIHPDNISGETTGNILLEGPELLVGPSA